MAYFSDDKLIVVYKQWTIGCVSQYKNSLTFEVLNGLVGSGGLHFTQSPVMFVDPNDLRVATREDFDRLRLHFSRLYTRKGGNIQSVLKL